MNCNELENNLQDFKEACYRKGYIYNQLTFDEAYPGVIPTPFIVNMVIQKSWKYSTISKSKALDKLIDVLWDKAKLEIRKNVFTLSLYTIDEMVNSERIRDREQIATNLDLNDEQIEQLSFDSEKSVRDRVIIRHRKTSTLTKKEKYSIFDICDDITINLLTERLAIDKDLENFALEDKYLKLKMLQYRI